MSQQLAEVVSSAKIIYLRIEPVRSRAEPEAPDFTINEEFKVWVFGSKSKAEVLINRSNAITVAGLFDLTVFNKELVDTVLTWNIKPLFSYFRKFLSKPFTVSNKVFDQKVVGNFLGLEEPAPENLAGAINRFKRLTEYKSWKQANQVYTRLHLPLITNVLPHLETTPLLNEQTKGSVYAYYEIEGQKNGRLRNYQGYQKGYVPHTMGAEVKGLLKPKGRENIFMYSDINHCEVTVLQWLSNDTALGQIINSGQGTYEGIYASLTGDECNTKNKRDMCKLLFLPVMYGCGVAGICENLKIGEDTARELIKRIHANFPIAIEWVLTKQREFERNGAIEDYFGRHRTKFDSAYKVRNFVVQAPAATVCLEKLVAITKAIEPLGAKVAFTVHDGYGIVCDVPASKAVFNAVKQCVEEESKLCPGLKLHMHAQFGRKLTTMKTFWK